MGGRGLIGDALSAVAPSSSRPVAEAPIPYSSSRGSALSATIGSARTTDRGAQLESMTAVGTIFAIVDALASGVSLVDWRLWRPAASGKEEDRAQVTKHALLDLWNRPNPFTTGQQYREAGQQHIDLTGEAWHVIYSVAGKPVEMWPVSPARISVVPHPKKFIAGYIYHGPDGEKIPLTTDELKLIRAPNPADPYRGAGAVQSVLIDVDSARYSAEWNRNFFLNSAEPGGIIEIPPELAPLSDDDFNQLRSRWREQHQGVSQAHRVAILEHGKWVDRKFTMRDMQFAELRGVSREVIREAFRFPKPLTGAVDDVNRAVAEAMNSIFAQWLLVPRLERWKAFANYDLLPMYSSGAGLELDYDSPVPADRAADREDLTARATAAKTLIDAQFDHAEVCAAVGLPIMAVRQLALAPADADAEALVRNVLRAELEPLRESLALTARREVLVLPSARAAYNLGKVAGEAYRAGLRNLADLDAVQADWQGQLDELLSRWQDEILPQQYEDLERKVREAVDKGDFAALAALAVSTAAAAELLAETMVEMGDIAAARVAGEAVAQGVPADEAVVTPPDAAWLGVVAGTTAGLLAAGLALSAGTEALRLADGAADGATVAAGVRAHLDALTDAQPALRLGGALTTAQNAGRAATLRSLPLATYYASEELDRNTCDPCGDIDGRQYESIADVLRDYPNGGYRGCQGGVRCRGTFVAKWEV